MSIGLVVRREEQKKITESREKRERLKKMLERQKKLAQLREEQEKEELERMHREIIELNQKRLVQFKMADRHGKQNEHDKRSRSRERCDPVKINKQRRDASEPEVILDTHDKVSKWLASTDSESMNEEGEECKIQYFSRKAMRELHK